MRPPTRRPPVVRSGSGPPSDSRDFQRVSNENTPCTGWSLGACVRAVPNALSGASHARRAQRCGRHATSRSKVHRSVGTLNDKVTVNTNGCGCPFNINGSYTHSRTAATAASSSSECDRRTRTSSTRPPRSTVASRITTPWTNARCAIGGYSGSTRCSKRGAVISPPTRTGARGEGTRGGGGGGVLSNPPTIPPATPPGTPYSKPAPCATFDDAIPSNPVSGVISAGASTGAAATTRGCGGTGFGATLAAFVGTVFGAAGTGAGGGGGGGGVALTKNAIVSFGVGSVSVA